MLAVESLWITFGPVVVINILMFASIFYYRFTGGAKSHGSEDAAKRSKSVFLSTFFKEWWLWLNRPIAAFFVRLGISPNMLSFTGFLFSCVAAGFFAVGNFGYAGWIMVFGATFDFFDGQVARLTNQMSRSGAFFDSTIDRFGEGICFLGISYYFRESWVFFFCILALIGSMMVSYTRARGQAVGIDCKKGSMQRPERVVYMGVGAILTPFASLLLMKFWPTPPPVLVMGSMVLMGVMTNATAVYRMISIMNSLDSEDKKKEEESLPQIFAKLGTAKGREELWQKARYGYEKKEQQHKRVVLFLTEELSSKLVHTLLSQGKLPHIQQHLLFPGGELPVVSNFPATAATALPPFVTGNFSGTCDIPGERWFDRAVPDHKVLTLNRFRDYQGFGAYALDYDLSEHVRTIYEYSKQAVNIFGSLNRGCGLVRDPAFFKHWKEYHEATSEKSREALLETSFQWFEKALLKESDFILFMVPSYLKPLQKDGEDARAVAYQEFDEVFGRAVEILQKNNMKDDSLLMLSGLYGSSEKKQSFDLVSFLNARLKTISWPIKHRSWLESDAIVMPSGQAMAHVYFRGEHTWQQNTFFEDIEQSGLIGALLERNELDIIAARSSEGGICVASKRGRARIAEDVDGRIVYLPKRGDPFSYKHISSNLNSREALLQTVKSEYPDAIMQLLQLFRSKRTGDLVITAQKGISLVAEDNSKRIYGGLEAEHLLVPLFMNECPNAHSLRTADIFTYIMGQLGIKPAHKFDGHRFEEFPSLERVLEA